MKTLIKQCMLFFLCPILAWTADAPFEIRRVVDENTLEAVKAEFREGEEIRILYLEKTPSLTAEHLAKATLRDEKYSGPAIEMELSPAGRDLFSDLTADSQGKMLAILVNGKVLTAPMVRQRITEGKLVITGRFTKKEAQAMVDALNAAIGESAPKTSP